MANKFWTKVFNTFKFGNKVVEAKEELDKKKKSKESWGMTAEEIAAISAEIEKIGKGNKNNKKQ